jgi:hypothetical protein
VPRVHPRLRRHGARSKRLSDANTAATLAVFVSIDRGTALAAHHHLLVCTSKVKANVLRVLRGHRGYRGFGCGTWPVTG